MNRTPRNPRDTKQAPVRSTPASGTWILETGGTGTGDGGGSDVIGPVTGFTSVGEIGTRFVTNPDRLVHMTVGFIPICPTPQPVTYLISPDNGQNWIWIGWQKMQNVGQQLHVDRLAPGTTTLWKVACAAGNLGGDPSPIPDASLNTMYVGVVRSDSFSVVGLSTPPTTTGITATIGSCSNVVSADGFTQYGTIPGVVYTDPVGSTAFFVRISVQILDAGFHALASEQPYGGTQITGGSHTEKALLVTYVPSLAFIRYRFYLANRNSQGDGDFNDPTTNALQMVSYNGGVPGDHYDVAVHVPTFIPISPDSAFNVLSVTAAEVGPKYQDTNQGLHTSVGITPVIDQDFSVPRTVTIWLDFGTGVAIRQGRYTLTGPGQAIRIGDSTLGTDGVRKSGNIWVPANTAQGNWKVYCGAGHIDNGINPSPYKVYPFTVTPVAACLPNGTTQAQFLNDPSTGDPISYSKYDPGVWYWEYYELTFVPPTLAADPNYWFTLITVQKGKTVGGVWTPSPDAEGINEDPFGHFLGRVHDQIGQLPGVSGGQTSVIRKFGNRPATWVIPVAQNSDGSANPYREFRFLLYNVSRLGTDTSGSGGAGTYTLQTSCWPGATDHFILIPQPQAASLDLRAANPLTITAPLTGGNGLPLTIPPYNPGTNTGGLGNAYLGPQSVQAINMAQNSITAANGALAASSVVDPNIVTLGINKVTYGVSVFAGDVVLSRGISKPVIILQNTGIFLFGQADASSGATGLTNHPFVGINNTGIGLFQGGTGAATGNGGPPTGGSIFLDGASAAVTIDTVNGDTTQPFFTVNASGLQLAMGDATKPFFSVNATNLSLAMGDATKPHFSVNATSLTLAMGGATNPSFTVNAASLSLMSGDSTKPFFNVTTTALALVNGVNSFVVNSNAMVFLDTGNKNRIDISSVGITITSGLKADGTPATSANQVVILSTALQLIYGGIPQVTINASGIIVSNGGTASVTITPSTVTIVNGSLTSPTINSPIISAGSITGTSLTISSGSLLINIDGTNQIKAHNSSSSVTAFHTGDYFRVERTNSPNNQFAQLGPLALSLNSNNNDLLQVSTGGITFTAGGGGSKTVIDANMIYRQGVQCTDHIIGSDFGISGVGFGVGTPGAPRTFTTTDGKTVTVIGGIITAITP